MSDFSIIKNALHAQMEAMTQEYRYLFKTDANKDELWGTYHVLNI